MLVNNKNQVWQTDITYYQIGDRFFYIVFIIDVYTRQILGYSASNHMRAEANVKALKMAIRNCNGVTKGIIHHSDHGR